MKFFDRKLQAGVAKAGGPPRGQPANSISGQPSRVSAGTGGASGITSSARELLTSSRSLGDLAEDRLLESVMLSQDDEAMRVVWNAAAAEGSLQGGRGGVDLKRFISATAKKASSEASNNSRTEDELFEELISTEPPAVQSGLRPAGQSLKPSRMRRPANCSHRSAAGEAAGRVAATAVMAAPPASQASPTAASKDLPGPPHCEGGAGGSNGQPNEPQRIPFPSPKTALKPSSTCKRVNSSQGRRRSSIGAKTPASAALGSTGKRRTAMLELLDQVEILVSQKSSPLQTGRRPATQTPKRPCLHGATGAGIGGSARRPTSERRRRAAIVGAPAGRQPLGAAHQLRMLQAAQSVDQLCNELLTESPTKPVGPNTLFDGAASAGILATTGAKEAKLPGKENTPSPPQPSHDSQPQQQKQRNCPSPAAGEVSRDRQPEGCTPEVEPRAQLLGDRQQLRHLVLEVLQDDCHGKTLLLRNEFDGQEVELRLLDAWADTPAAAGDSLNLMAEVELHSACENGRRRATVDSQCGLVVLHPDLLVSGTTVTTACKCQRQAAIDQLVGGDSGASEKAVLGTLLHKLFQVVLTFESGGGGCQSSDEAAMKGTVDDIVQSSTMDLFQVGLSEATARTALVDAIPVILRWKELFCRASPVNASVVDMGPKGPGDEGLGAQRCAIVDVIDIEESIWSPRFGLKVGDDRCLCEAPLGVGGPEEQQHAGSGPITATAAGRRAQDLPGEDASAAMDPSEIRVAPLELKTGKSYHGHRAQVALYMLLMADRYTADVSAGLLWYMHEQKPQGVQYIHLEVASLIQVRNGLAAHLASRAPAGLGPSLPPMLQDPKACGSCFQREACMLLHKGVEGGTPETAGAGNVFDEDTSHLRRTHTEFLRRWMALVQAEEQEGGGRLADVWALSSDEKVAKGGTCVGRLHLLGRAQEPATDQGNQAAIYQFGRHPPSTALAGAEGGIGALASGDRIILSVEGYHAAVARGTVTATSGGIITLRLWSRLSAHTTSAAEAAAAISGGRGVWRIDGDNSLSMAATLRGNILSLFRNASGRLPRLRQLLVDLAPPEATKAIEEPMARYLASHTQVMNPDQVQAVRKVLQAHDYAVIQGMPGTGKTSTICHIVGALAAAGRSVLLTAYTNSAVDNVLLRLKAGGRYDFLRIGSRGAIHPDLQPKFFPTEKIVDLHAHPTRGAELWRMTPLLLTAPSFFLSTNLLHMQTSLACCTGAWIVLLGLIAPSAIALLCPHAHNPKYLRHRSHRNISRFPMLIDKLHCHAAHMSICCILFQVDKGQGRDAIGSHTSTPCPRLPFPSCQDNCLGGARFPGRSVAELQDLAANIAVVGSTCMSIGHPLLQGRHFDVVVVDEASQITLPASLGPLSMAGKFVLVGDDHQLPPLVINRGASEGGLSTSLFETLSRAHPAACAVLSSQYRMCSPIMELANSLVYSGAMRCGSPAIASARLPLSPGAAEMAGLSSWLQKVVSPLEPLLFLDTGAGSREAKAGTSLCNPGEANLVTQCLAALVAAGMDGGTAAVISPYRAQVAELSKAVRRQPSMGSVEVLTVDKSQGRDKNCVLMSLVKSNEEGQPGDLLTDWRRINVAITRAKHKLVLVGCAATLAAVPMFDSLLQQARRGGWLLQVPDSGAQGPQISEASTTPLHCRVGSQACSRLPVGHGRLVGKTCPTLTYPTLPWPSNPTEPGPLAGLWESHPERPSASQGGAVLHVRSEAKGGEMPAATRQGMPFACKANCLAFFHDL
eukprot:CAMPEP_0117649998 /NCGR_PEP_ID=MMETSP0804-20121206/1299_1 /TAXON_ID=1074897 /ORGANISM="Tetraselmis astigmatica, Strain CCMP880" /LENGTH=1750 /DNA_ID=CAMNT_0005455829 /DNA_START=245 /DNA_END=5500 /DNA_ORIENTATION=-